MTKRPNVIIENKKVDYDFPVRIYDPKGAIESKFDFYIKIVVGILVVAVITMLFMVGGFLLDALHFNSAVYKEYSDKTKSLESFQESNNLLLEQNRQNQQLILDQQKQILDKLSK